MNANPFGQPDTVGDGDSQRPSGRSAYLDPLFSQCVKAYFAVLTMSFGVVVGRAIMTAKNSLAQSRKLVRHRGDGAKLTDAMFRKT